MSKTIKELQELYRFYILNPAHSQGVNYSLWIQQDDYEYAVVQSNTGGFTTFSSQDKGVGNGIEPTEQFFELLGTLVHEAMCMMPSIFFKDERHVMNTAESIYDGKPREHELWAATVLAQEFTLGERLISELEPLAEHADQYSKIDTPILGGSE